MKLESKDSRDIPGPSFRGCQLLSLKPTIVEGLQEGWLIQINNSAFLWSLQTFHRIYKRLFSVNFLIFQSLLHFMKRKFGVTSSFMMKSSFSQNQIFNKMRNSYASFFLVSCLAPFVADITFISLLFSQIYVCTTSYRLFNVPSRT